MTSIRPPRRVAAAHPVLDWLEQTRGVGLVIAASVAVAGTAVAVRLLIFAS